MGRWNLPSNNDEALHFDGVLPDLNSPNVAEVKFLSQQIAA
jgi:hypothetical protein